MPSGASFVRKGRGADAGVECYWILPTGKEIGWQAKFLFTWDNSLASQLDDSIETALSKHPKLSKYIVCIPFDLSDGRATKTQSAQAKWKAWKAKWERKAKTRRRTLNITLWSKSSISRRLATDAPTHTGRLLYWFGKEALTQSWFLDQFEKTRASLGTRYTPSTNVELPIREAFFALARNPGLQSKIDEWCSRLHEEGLVASRAIRDAAGKGLDSHSASLRTRIDDVVNRLGIAPIGPENAYPLDDWLTGISQCLEVTRLALHWTFSLPDDTKDTYRDTPPRRAQYHLHKLNDLLADIKDALESQPWQLANAKAALLIGPAGIGKSHLLADIVEHQLEANRPAIMILGSSLADGEPWRQIMTQLDLPPNQQVKHFLGSLDAAAQAAGVRVLICVDALNERNGLEIWPERIAAFLKAAEPFPRICLALSCRTTYLAYVIPESIDSSALLHVEHPGFGSDGGIAASMYLAKRGIIRPGAPNLVPEFQNPLFLKTCCDFLEREGKREIPRGLRGVTAIFEFYNQAVAGALNRRMKLDPHMEIIPSAVGGFAGRLAERGEGYLPKADAISFFEAILPSHGALERSLLAQFESEGVLTVELIQNDDDSIASMVRFTFERFSDHAIAARLLRDHLNIGDIESSFGSDETLGKLVFGKEHYRYSGIIEAIAIQLPEVAKREILDVGDHNYWHLREAFFESLLWRDQSHFTDNTFKLLVKHADRNRINDLLISISTEPANKYNARFLHEKLMGFSMPKRDQFWSTYIAEHGEFEGSSIETLIEWALHSGMDPIEDDRVELAATILAWFLATTNRPIRDKATKALAMLFANRLLLAAKLLTLFSEINDLYVLERLFAAAYGAALQGTTKPGLDELAYSAYSIAFIHQTPPMNALLRDHALGIVKYAEWRGQLPSTVDLRKVEPPYRSPWPIEHVSDELIKSYKMDYGGGHSYSDPIVSSAVDDGDFARYVIDSRLGDWSPAPIGTTKFPKISDIFDKWLDDFRAIATEAEAEAFIRIVDASKATKGQAPYQQTPERTALDDANETSRKLLTADAWEEYRVRAKHFVEHFAFSDRPFSDHPARFSTQWARRWVCKRAHELGWTPELFGEFDRRRSHDRMDHRVERIGKKYQWLALYELAARMSDNLAYIGGYGDRPDGSAKKYGSAHEINLRNMDPSLLVTETSYDGWAQWDRTWWVPVEASLREISPTARLAWLESDNDVFNDSSLIDVTNPKTKKRYLSLHSFASWRQSGVGVRRKELQRDTWFRLHCVIVRKKDLRKAINSLTGKTLTNPSSLPHIELHGDHYLGEYPWHPTLEGVDAWTGKADWHATAVPMRATVADYTSERSSFDHSIDKTISVQLPAPWLAKAMGMRLSDGKQLTYVGTTGKELFFDPSVTKDGPQAALVDRDAFLSTLRREELSAIWVIAGEKSVYGEGDRGFGGRVLYTSIYYLKGKSFEQQVHWEREEPTEEQLRAYLRRERESSLEGIRVSQEQPKSRRLKKRTPMRKTRAVRKR